jgi:hypothetical protein
MKVTNVTIVPTLNRGLLDLYGLGALEDDLLGAAVGFFFGFAVLGVLSAMRLTSSPAGNPG